MARTLTEEQRVKLAEVLILMDVPKEMSFTILSVIETPEALCLFLDKLAEKNYDMPPQEVYDACLETILETQTKEFEEMREENKSLAEAIDKLMNAYDKHGFSDEFVFNIDNEIGNREEISALADMLETAQNPTEEDVREMLKTLKSKRRGYSEDTFRY